LDGVEEKMNESEMKANLKTLALCVVMIAVIVGISALASGQSASMCRIYIEDGRNMQSIGTGTLVDSRVATADKTAGGLVVTCNHIFADRKPGGKITAVFPNGSRHQATLLGNDASHDLAALSIGSPTVPAIGVGEFQADDTFRAGGFGKDATLKLVSGEATPIQPDNWFRTQGGLREGDSGGPLFNSSGRLVGVAWGTDGRVALSCEYVDFCQFLRRWNVGSNCANGQCTQPTVVRAAPVAQVPTLAPKPASKPAIVAGCNCKDKLSALEARIDFLDQEVAALKKRPVAVDGKDGEPGLAGAAGVSPPPLDITAIQALLTHSAVLMMDDGTIKSQTKSLNEPLEFVRRDTTAK
jgi:hypothetical protein